MPNQGLWYASGPKEMREAIAVSAFSAGDVLCHDSNSSLSRMPAGFPLRVAGIATSASTASANQLVPYIVPEADTIFWSEATSTSQHTRGARRFLEYTGAKFMVSNALSSQTTALVTVERGSEDVAGQSVQSRVLVKFLRTTSAGRVDTGA
jgi:hypothetical protein